MDSVLEVLLEYNLQLVLKIVFKYTQLASKTWPW